MRRGAPAALGNVRRGSPCRGRRGLPRELRFEGPSSPHTRESRLPSYGTGNTQDGKTRARRRWRERRPGGGLAVEQGDRGQASEVCLTAAPAPHQGAEQSGLGQPTQPTDSRVGGRPGLWRGPELAGEKARAVLGEAAGGFEVQGGEGTLRSAWQASTQQREGRCLQAASVEQGTPQGTRALREEGVLSPGSSRGCVQDTLGSSSNERGERGWRQHAESRQALGQRGRASGACAAPALPLVTCCLPTRRSLEGPVVGSGQNRSPGAQGARAACGPLLAVSDNRASTRRGSGV